MYFDVLEINKCFNINVFLFVTSNIYLSADLVQNTKHNK